MDRTHKTPEELRREEEINNPHRIAKNIILKTCSNDMLPYPFLHSNREANITRTSWQYSFITTTSSFILTRNGDINQFTTFKSIYDPPSLCLEGVKSISKKQKIFKTTCLIIMGILFFLLTVALANFILTVIRSYNKTPVEIESNVK